MASDRGPRSDRDILVSAARSLGRIDLLGPRGLTGLSLHDIEDMALALVVLGLAPPFPAPADCTGADRFPPPEGVLT